MLVLKYFKLIACIHDNEEHTKKIETILQEWKYLLLLLLLLVDPSKPCDSQTVVRVGLIIWIYLKKGYQQPGYVWHTLFAVKTHKLFSF